MKRGDTWYERGQRDGEEIALINWFELRTEIKKSMKSKSLEARFIIPSMNHPRVKPTGLKVKDLSEWERGFIEAYKDKITYLILNEGPLEKKQREEAKRKKEEGIKREQERICKEEVQRQILERREREEAAARALVEREQALARTHVPVLVFKLEDRAYLEEFIKRAGFEVLPPCMESDNTILYQESHSGLQRYSTDWFIVPIPKSIVDNLPSDLLYVILNRFFQLGYDPNRLHYPVMKDVELRKLIDSLIQRGHSLDEATEIAKQMSKLKVASKSKSYTEPDIARSELPKFKPYQRPLEEEEGAERALIEQLSKRFKKST